MATLRLVYLARERRDQGYTSRTLVRSKRRQHTNSG